MARCRGRRIVTGTRSACPAGGKLGRHTDQRLTERQVQLHRPTQRVRSRRRAPANATACARGRRRRPRPATTGHGGRRGRSDRSSAVRRRRAAPPVDRPSRRSSGSRTIRPRRPPARNWPRRSRSCRAAAPERRRRPSPSATNPATRSSWTTCRARSARFAIANAIGVDRDPGATTAWRTPQADPFVDERRAERRLHVLGPRARGRWVRTADHGDQTIRAYRGDRGDERTCRIPSRRDRRHLLRCRLPLVLHRQAEIRDGPWPRRRRRPRRRLRRDLPAVPARSVGCARQRPSR